MQFLIAGTDPHPHSYHRVVQSQLLRQRHQVEWMAQGRFPRGGEGLTGFLRTGRSFRVSENVRGEGYAFKIKRNAFKSPPTSCDLGMRSRAALSPVSQAGHWFLEGGGGVRDMASWDRP